jgi:peptidoglycan/xylan/chitin deacetylase (PgdA/CDA1 family)
MSADGVLARVVGALRPGAIVLMHVGSNPDDGTTFDADALPRVIDQIRAQGYTFVTLERVLPATP